MALARMFIRIRGSLQAAQGKYWNCVVAGSRNTQRSNRWQHTAPQTSCNWQLLDSCLELDYDGHVMHFDYVWLRDHCRSASCLNSKTNQRSLDTGTIDLNIRPMKTRVEEGNLYLTWPDGHVTRYTLPWMLKNSYEFQKQNLVQPRILWNSEMYSQANVPSANWEKFLSSDEELKDFLNNFLRYGIAFVDGVPDSVEATEATSERLGLIRETTYGRMWSLTSDFSRGDTAYTKMALDRHTDSTYYHEPCGIQVLHGLRHEGTGGRTVLVDGFYAANQVRQQSPENFELLSQVHVKHEFIENQGSNRNHMIGIGPVISLYPWNKEVYMIRYNNYDRAVLNTVPHDVVRRWYIAHRQLTEELRKPENELWIKLKPGRVLFIDNWRVMHGRESFTGFRQICGCYLTRDDVVSKARVLGLQA